MSIQYATHSFRMCLDYENDMNGIWHFYTIVEQQYAQESVLEWTGVLVLAWWHFNNSADKECKCFCLCSKIDQHKLTRGCFLRADAVELFSYFTYFSEHFVISWLYPWFATHPVPSWIFALVCWFRHIKHALSSAFKHINCSSKLYALHFEWISASACISCLVHLHLLHGAHTCTWLYY